FQAVYESVYGYRLSAPADIVTLRVKAIGRIPAPSLKPIERGGPDPEGARKGRRKVYDFLESEAREFRVFDRTRLKAGNVIVGPALIEEATTTTVVRHHHTCAVDSVG